MPTQLDKPEESDDQEQDESSSEYYSPQLQASATFSPASIVDTETAISSQYSFNLNGTSRKCKCGAFIDYDDVNSHEPMPSHDISTSGYHLQLDEWLNDLTNAIDAAWPRRHITYSDVHVLMITWEDNDIPHMEREVTRLGNVLADEFGYDMHRLIVPAFKADLKIRREVDGFIEEYGQQDNLLIVYYAGHARHGTHSGAPPIWHSKNRDGDLGTSFDTANIQPILARAQDDSPDVLLIYDCCHSLYAHPTNDKNSRAVVECLFAGGFETKVPNAGPDSFTMALIDELCEALYSSAPLSVADLHRGIIDRLQNWKARGMFTKDGKTKKDKRTGKIALTKPVRTTPIHMSLSVNETPRTIFLAPKKKQVLHLQQDQNGKKSEAEHTKPPKVLLAVRLVENDYNTEALKKWILAAPHSVVKFEKIYRSYSELLLVELPLQVWDLLPRNPAVTFVGFVRGEKPIGISNTNIPPSSSNQIFRTFQTHEREMKPGRRLTGGSATDQTPADSQLISAMDYPHTYLHNSEIREDRRLVTVLGAVDRVLPKTFVHLEKSGNEDRFQLKFLFDQVLEDLNEIPDEVKVISEDDILQYKTFIFQYISAKHLIKYGPSWLDVANRLTGPLGRLYDWYWHNDDDRADSTSIPETTHQTFSEASTNHSKLWSNPSSGGWSSGISPSMLESTPDISIETVLQKKPLDIENEPARNIVKEKDESHPEPTSHDLPRAKKNPEKGIAQSYPTTTDTPDPVVQDSNTGETAQNHSEITDSLQHGLQQKLQDTNPEPNTRALPVIRLKGAENDDESEVQRTGLSYAHEQLMKTYMKGDRDSMSSLDKLLVELTGNEQSIAMATRNKVVSFDPELEYLSEDSDSDSDSQPSVSSDLAAPIVEFEHYEITELEADYPTIKSRHAAINDPMETASVKSYLYPSVSTERVDVEDPRTFLDARYRIHKHTEFQPGRVFKILWSEQTDARTLGVKGRSGGKFYIGFRRFIIVATEEEGHSTCVPILTYERRGCTKSGVNPKTHGIVYSVLGNTGERGPRLLKGEPELGFPPIKVDGYKDDEPLPKESRVNYAKLITIEHNVKVFFIGFIPLLDFGKLVHATNECWEQNMRKGR
ncbi:hypothetical protein F4781DRAFT_387965 [Annulohypoxylon bovei var. microspora]|nr:hypothetical protein F4781DRAFT_387965 [Annulohypoxylon bovei var. microspora]